MSEDRVEHEADAGSSTSPIGTDPGSSLRDELEDLLECFKTHVHTALADLDIRRAPTECAETSSEAGVVARVESSKDRRELLAERIEQCQERLSTLLQLADSGRMDRLERIVGDLCARLDVDPSPSLNMKAA